MDEQDWIPAGVVAEHAEHAREQAEQDVFALTLYRRTLEGASITDLVQEYQQPPQEIARLLARGRAILAAEAVRDTAAALDDAMARANLLIGQALADRPTEGTKATALAFRVSQYLDSLRGVQPAARVEVGVRGMTEQEVAATVESLARQRRRAADAPDEDDAAES